MKLRSEALSLIIHVNTAKDVHPKVKSRGSPANRTEGKPELQQHAIRPLAGRPLFC